MKIKTVKSKYPYKDACAMLNANKADRCIGSGCYASVYSHRSLDRVYKLGEVVSNAGYLAYLKQIIKHGQDNPLAPKIYTVTMFKDPSGHEDNYFVVEMEKLRSLNGKTKAAARVLRNMINDDYGVDAVAEIVRGEGIGIKVHIPAAVTDIVKMIKRAANTKSSRAAGVDFDLHFGNFMQRGDQLVVTDPLA